MQFLNVIHSCILVFSSNCSDNYYVTGKCNLLTGNTHSGETTDGEYLGITTRKVFKLLLT